MTGIETLFAIFFLGSIEGAVNPQDSMLEAFWEDTCTTALQGDWVNEHTPEARCENVIWQGKVVRTQ